MTLPERPLHIMCQHDESREGEHLLGRIVAAPQYLGRVSVLFESIGIWPQQDVNHQIGQ